MAKILVADDEHSVRSALVELLFGAGHDVIEAENGRAAYDKACQQLPDLILLDVKMPLMDGFEVLARLRETPVTETMPVVMLTALTSSKGELRAWRLGARHFIIKPFARGRVELTVKVALREAEIATEDTADARDGQAPKMWQGSNSDRGTGVVQEDIARISAGTTQLDQILEGGIPLNSLTLIEGTPLTGKSVLCQHIAFEALRAGHGVSYFTSDNTPNGLMAQMDSIGLEVTKYSQSGKFAINPLKDAPDLDEQCELSQEPEFLIDSFARELQRSPDLNNVVIADAITNLVTYNEERSILRFFSTCRRLCNDGRAIILVAQSHSFDDRLLGRVQDLCDAHLSLRKEKLGVNGGTMLEVVKTNNTQLDKGNDVSFEVRSGTGINMMAFGKVRV